jgi:ribose 5-phosphate isomerase RpiB
MKIALMNEFSQASKNTLILETLKKTVEPMGHQVFNTGMSSTDNDKDRSDPSYLTYLNLGVQAALLLNSGAVDFVIAGCGTGQGALMALNSFPGVVCGYCIRPDDAYLFNQINNGNALSIPFAKGFGWGAELNLEDIFRRAFGSPKGMGYPNEPGRKESQNRNAAALFQMKKDVHKPLIEGLKSMDQEILKHSLTPRFLEVFNNGCKDPALKEYVDSLVR